VRPRLVELGEVTQLRVELPQLRAGPGPVRLEVEGEEVDVLATSRLGAFGAETRWNVRIRVRPSAPTGDTLIVLRGVFPDGESVEVDGNITVVPPEPAETSSSGIFWVGAGVGVVLALALAAAALLAARRRSA
jgi:hypothetical protein